MPSPSQPDRSTPDALRAAWVDAVAAREPAALRHLLTDDYEVWAHGAPAVRGVDGAIAALTGALSRFDIEQSFDVEETVVMGEWAFQRGTERMRLRPVGGGPETRMEQRALLIMRRD